MNGLRKQLVAAIFEEVFELPPEEQGRFVTWKCRGDIELRQEVERLLELDRHAPLSIPAPHRAGGPAKEAPATAPLARLEAQTGTLGSKSMASIQTKSSTQGAITIGTVIGRHRIVAKLGEGGMGIVFAARHEELGHHAVVKVLTRRAMENTTMMRRFENEARIAALIRHPGVVQLMDFGRHESGALFILMECLFGESIKQRLERLGKLPPRIALSFVLQTARALDAIHAQGVVHRDLKPDNLFLVPDPDVPGGERVKILDFGIAKAPNIPLPRLTPFRMAMGTPPYMPWEQFQDASGVSCHADLYSLGVVLFEMLCGRLPFVCQTAGEYAIAHREKTPLPVSQFVQVSRALDEVVARLLAKRFWDRFASTRALIEALEALPEMQDLSTQESDVITREAPPKRVRPSDLIRVPHQLEIMPTLSGGHPASAIQSANTEPETTGHVPAPTAPLAVDTLSEPPEEVQATTPEPIGYASTIYVPAQREAPEEHQARVDDVCQDPGSPDKVVIVHEAPPDLAHPSDLVQVPDQRETMPARSRARLARCSELPSDIQSADTESETPGHTPAPADLPAVHTLPEPTEGVQTTLRSEFTQVTAVGVGTLMVAILVALAVQYGPDIATWLASLRPYPVV